MVTKHCETFRPDHGPVVEVAASVGIELRGEDGQPYHCGERMTVYSGVVGPDRASCEACGLTIENGLSPHMNGGYFLPDDVFEAHPHGAWWVNDGGNP